MKVIICKECGKKINSDKDKHTLIGTYTGNNADDETYFHYNCFVKWYNQRVTEKAKNSVSSMQEKAKSIFSKIQEHPMVQNVVGFGKLKDILDTDLKIAQDINKDIPSLQEALEQFDEAPKKKPKNDRPKKAKRRNKKA